MNEEMSAISVEVLKGLDGVRVLELGCGISRVTLEVTVMLRLEDETLVVRDVALPSNDV